MLPAKIIVKMKKPLYILFFLVLPVIAFGQHLIPYLSKNDKYGFANQNGEILIKPMSNTCPYPMTPQRPSTKITIDGVEKGILRNGMIVEATEYFPVLHFSGSKTLKPDTLFNILWGVANKKLILINLTTKKVATYHTLPTQQKYIWLSKNFDILNFHFSHEGAPIFYKGSMNVWSSEDSINFVDMELNEIFPRNFTLCNQLDEQYFVLADVPSKYALGDSTGQIRTPAIWTSIRTSKKTGIFIVNMQRDAFKAKAGLIDANGVVMLDTVYQSIVESATGKHIIVKKNGLYGICDYNGRTLLPVEYHQIEEISQTGYLRVSRDGERWDILNHDLESILDAPADRISNPSGMGSIRVIVEKNRVKSYYDENMRLIIIDSLRQDIRIISQDPLMINHTHYLKGEGIMDAYHNEILPQQYSSIYWRNGYFEVRKIEGWRGVRDIKGNIVVPEICEDISVEVTPNGRVFWCMDSTYFWTPYDSTGRVIGIDKKVRPSSNSDNFVGMSCKIKSTVGGLMRQASYSQDCVMVLSDGTIKPLNDSLVLTSGTALFLDYVPQIRTREGGFIINWRDENKYYFNHHLQNLIKPGYDVLSLFNDQKKQIEHVKNTELLPILKYAAVSEPIEDISIRAVLHDAIADSEMPMFYTEDNTERNRPEGALPDLLKANKFQPNMGQTEIYKDFEAGGIINAKGEWVIPPKLGVKFIPLSYYLALEVPIDFEFIPNRIYDEPLKIHKIHQNDTAIIQINRIGSYYFKSGDNISISKPDPTGEYLIDAYINEKGDFITAFDVINGPSILGDQNLITVVSASENNQFSQRIIGKNGMIIKELETLICPHPNAQIRKEEAVQNSFFIVENRRPEKYAPSTKSVDEKAKLAQGIMDSLGVLVTNLKYINIKILIPGQLFSAYDLKGRFKLYGWDEKVIFTFKQIKEGIPKPMPSSKSVYELSVKKIPDGKTLVFNDETTLILSSDNTLLEKVPCTFQYVNNVEGKNYIVVSDLKSKKKFFVDVNTGYKFKD